MDAFKYGCIGSIRNEMMSINSTSVKRSLASLVKAEHVYCLGGEYKFVSPFFREWIKIRF